MTRRGAALACAAPAMLLSGCFGAPPPAAPQPPRVAAPVERQAGPRYIVQPGDTFRGIANRFGVDMADLGAINGVALPYVIRIGQALRVPLPRRPEPDRAPERPSDRVEPRRAPERAPARVVERTDPGRAIARPAARAPFQPVPRAAPMPGAPRLAWPTDGAIAAGFGALVDGVPNRGIDLTAYRGMAVRAAAAGRVIFAGREPARFGQLVVIDHGNGWATAYAYLGDLTVRDGDIVRAGERIARIGETGDPRRATLHFELRRDNRPVDPAPQLPQRL